ncbi:MAG: hypothetical protein JWM68_1580, partial [Verrucomicrobiales bacterium]|nr:hypothetical protein [Verrucomicrobiales bacterium]
MTESEKKKRKIVQPPDNNFVQIQVPRSIPSILCVLLIVPYLIAAGYFWQRSRSTVTSDGQPSKTAVLPDETHLVKDAKDKPLLLKPGPWGEVEYVPLLIEC